MGSRSLCYGCDQLHCSSMPTHGTGHLCCGVPIRVSCVMEMGNSDGNPTWLDVEIEISGWNLKMGLMPPDHNSHANLCQGSRCGVHCSDQQYLGDVVLLVLCSGAWLSRVWSAGPDSSIGATPPHSSRTAIAFCVTLSWSG